MSKKEVGELIKASLILVYVSSGNWYINTDYILRITLENKEVSIASGSTLYFLKVTDEELSNIKAAMGVYGEGR